MKKCSITRRRDNLIIYIFLSILFILNSFITWAMLTFVLLTNASARVRFLHIWLVLSILFISLYNATKIPENDLKWYVDFYLMADRMPLMEYLNLLAGGKEQIYQLLVWCISLLGGRNSYFYIFCMSVLSYSFLLKSILLYRNSLKLTNIEVITVGSVLVFFPYLFALSVHLMRQFLSISIMIYIISMKACSNRRLYALMIIDLFIHTSSIFFIPFLFISELYNSIRLKRILVYAVIVIGLLSLKMIFVYIVPFTVNTPLEYVAKKIANGTTFETELSLFKLLFAVLLVSLAVLFIYFKNTRLKKEQSMNYFVNISLILLLFIIINYDQPELQLRYNLCFWLFTPFFVAFYLRAITVPPLILYLCIISMFLIWNIYNMYFSEWTYTCRFDYFLYPMWHYLLY